MKIKKIEMQKKNRKCNELHNQKSSRLCIIGRKYFCSRLLVLPNGKRFRFMTGFPVAKFRTREE